MLCLEEPSMTNNQVVVLIMKAEASVIKMAEKRVGREEEVELTD